MGYYGQPGLPKCQCSTPLEYFARAVGWLRAQPAGRGRPVVMYGASDRAQAALLTASYLPHLANAVVASSPTDFGMYPYYPFFTNALLGGTAQANALATEQFWASMIKFLNKTSAPLK